MRRLENLLGQPGGEPETTREEHPDGSWRADALAKSRHARLTEHLRQPLDERDPERAREICAEVCRDLLGDLAPALVFLAPEERLRCQVLATWGRMLFDFADQGGVEGERLAALNRLEFELEQALSGEPQGQPAFIGLAIEEARRPWPREALDALMAAARSRVVEPRLATAADLEASTLRTAGAVVTALTGEAVAPEVAGLGAAILRMRALLGLAEALRRDRAPLPVAELPSPGDLRRPLDRRGLEAAIGAELERLRPLLRARTTLDSLPRGYRPAVRYLRLAALALADRVAPAPARLLDAPPRLGLGRRLQLLLRARLTG